MMDNVTKENRRVVLMDVVIEEVLVWVYCGWRPLEEGEEETLEAAGYSVMSIEEYQDKVILFLKEAGYEKMPKEITLEVMQRNEEELGLYWEVRMGNGVELCMEEEDILREEPAFSNPILQYQWDSLTEGLKVDIA